MSLHETKNIRGLRAPPGLEIGEKPAPRVEHNKAGLGNLSVTEYSLNGIDIFDVKDCKGVDGAYYPEHIVTMFKRPYVMDANWEGERFQRQWKNGNVVFIPARSCLNHAAHTPYDETVIRLKDELFVQASREHIDHSQIDFSFRDVTSEATWNFGFALAGIVMSVGYRHWPMLVETSAIALVLAVIRELAPNATTAFKTVRYGLSETRRKRVLSYIDDNISRQITLSELAAVANLSLYHFTRKFKNRMGMTPLRYLSNRRVDVAQRLLRSTNASLVEISLACGFASQSHFNTVFKKVTGTTPASYRFEGA